MYVPSDGEGPDTDAQNPTSNGSLEQQSLLIEGCCRDSTHLTQQLRRI